MHYIFVQYQVLKPLLITLTHVDFLLEMLSGIYLRTVS